MLLNFYNLFFVVMTQGSGVAPPPPKSGPSPPVGDPVPLDGNLWLLLLGALIIGISYSYYIERKKVL